MYFNYFYNNPNKKLKLTPAFYIKQRKFRDLIKGSCLLKLFKVGDIIEFVYHYKCIPLIFNGICISIKYKYFIKSDVTLILRNVIMKVGLELTVSYYYNRLYKLKFLDYKRKFYNFNKNKLYFIRKRVNRESKVD
jgi:ribosomal protein L19